MLSYNKKNIDNLFEEIVNRIDRNLEKSIYIKQENQKCAQVSQEESNEMAKSDMEEEPPPEGGEEELELEF